MTASSAAKASAARPAATAPPRSGRRHIDYVCPPAAATRPSDRLVQRTPGLGPHDAVHVQAALGLELQMESVYANCTPDSGTAAGEPVLSSSGWTGLTAARPDKEPVMDRPGIILQVLSAGGDKSRLLLWGCDTRPVRWSSGDTSYAFVMRRKRVPLPRSSS